MSYALGTRNFAVPRGKKLADRFRRRRWVRAMQCIRTQEEEQQQVRYSSSCRAAEDNEGGNRMKCGALFVLHVRDSENPWYCPR